MAAIGNKTNERTSVRFTVAEFVRLVKQIAKDARRRKSLTAADYYRPIKKSGGLTREPPLADSALLAAISRYLDELMTLKKPLKPNDPLPIAIVGNIRGYTTLASVFRPVSVGRRFRLAEVLHETCRLRLVEVNFGFL